MSISNLFHGIWIKLRIWFDIRLAYIKLVIDHGEKKAREGQDSGGKVVISPIVIDILVIELVLLIFVFF